ncbi:BEACH domain-containing protein C2 [Zea mays]|uniref:BEACH domain-containing protein C2 n=1 Tax=Zea mays TaxID=4577 RepID=A0A1D6HFA9_MAIZE|nr:BEACH domain-containing protein C2 [Zea mays]
MGEEDTGEMPDASPPAPWEHGVDERFADESLGLFDDEAYTVEEEDVSDTEMTAGSPAAPSEPSPPLRRRLAPVVPSDVPEQVVRAVDAVIMGGGVERLRDMVSEENGEVSHFIVDVLMVTMGGVDGLDEGAGEGIGAATGLPPSIMSSSRAAAIAAELVPYLPFGVEPSPRTRMTRGLLATLSACTRNRTMCAASGLLAVLLEVAEKLFVGMGRGSKWDGTPLVQCIQVLGGHSVSVRDLHTWLLLIKKALGTQWATQLTIALENAVASNEAKGPAVTFEFDGESSGLLAPGDNRWPFSNGLGFATWIYVESFSGSLNTATATAAVAAAAASASGKSSPSAAAAAACTLAGEGTKHMPRIFSFLTSENHGIEAYFNDQFLVVESAAGKGKKASLHFTYEFKPRCWYFVGLEHSSKQALLGKSESELRLYVDGDLHESCPFEPPRIVKPLVFCCIGTNPSPTIAGLQRRRRQCPLFAEMGPIYIFTEPIGPEKMSRLASRGGDALPSFGNGAGFPWKATSNHIRETAEDGYTLDIEIGGSLHLLYHPSLLNGRFCSDASPSGSTGTHRRPAEVLGMVHISNRVRPAESLWALAYGGPMALLPLIVSNVEMDNLEPILGDLSSSLATASLSVPIFRIISVAVQHPGNKEELCRTHGPELLSQVLHYVLDTLSRLESGKKEILSDEELVTAIVSLCQSQRNDHSQKVQLFSTLLLDLKMWSSCNYILQKKLLSSLADMVFAESTCMRDANALQMLLDGCRRCYWVVHEADSIDTFTLTGNERPLGNVNALVDELLVVIELLIGAAPSTLASDDVRCLVGFIVDCPQPNQVARVLLLIYRLIVHPNTSRANTFAQSFISRGVVEALLVLLQREAKSGDSNILHSCNVSHDSASWNESSKLTNKDSKFKNASGETNCQDHQIQSVQHYEPNSHETGVGLGSTSKWSLLKGQFLKNLGGMDVPNISDNVQNIDNGDGVLVGIVRVLGALVASGHLTSTSPTVRPKLPSGFLTTSNGEGNTMFEDRVSLLLFALQKAFQAAPRRLMTRNVYTALISSVINVSSKDNLKNLQDSGYHFKHIPLLVVLLRSLPYASRSFQARVIQDLLYLVCSHPKNRSTMTSINEWPECILEVLISNHEMGDNKDSDGISICEVEDVVHNLLLVVLQHSMRKKDGWKDVEATIHCAEWLSMVGGTSTGDQRIRLVISCAILFFLRREEALPIFKRRLLGSLLNFSAQELQVQQTEGIAAAAAGVAAEGLVPKETKVHAEKVANLSVMLAENAVVLLMLVEDHLRSRSQQFFMACLADSAASPASMASSAVSRSNSLSRTGSEHLEAGDSRQSLSSDAGGLPVDVLASTVDTNGQLSAEVMERVTAAAAAEPYGSVRHAFVSYGSCISDLSEGWKYRTRLWYGVCIPPKSNVFGGGGSGWVSWKSVLEKDSDGNWIELPLVKKSVAMLQALLLDSGLGGCLDSGVGFGPGMGVMGAFNQLLDSDQPFFCMLRLILVSMREDDSGEDDIFMRNISMKNVISEVLGCQTGSMLGLGGNSSASMRKRPAALLWRVLGPVLNMPVSESKRQRVLVASSILYSELWHAVSSDRKPVRKKYVGLIMPPFVAVLKRYRSVLAGIHELTCPDVQNPLLIDDWASTADTSPVEVGVAMISPAWAAAFASPPVAMALAMIAAGASGTETIAPPTNKLRRRDTSLLERRAAKLHTFSSFQMPIDTTPSLPTSAPKDKAAAKAAALAAARDLERSAKIGSRRGLSAVAMATSGQRRSAGDIERAQRWNISEAMGAAWMECLQSADSKSVSGRDFSALSYKYVALLVSSFALARNLQRVEIFWKLDLTESSLRMRRFMKRNYNWLNHLGASANYVEQKFLCDGADACHSEDGDSLLSVLPASSLITVDEVHEQIVQRQSDNICSSVDDQLTDSSTTDQIFTGSIDSRSSDFSGVRNLIRSTVVTPGYKTNNERIIIELPSMMIRPLKVVRGTFQVTSKRINFIVDEHMSDSYMDDIASTSGQYDQQDRDRSWFLSSLHQIFSRRYLLRQSALELFMVDRSNFLFDFEDIGSRTHAYRALVHTKPPYLNTVSVATQRPEQIFKQTQLMERWAKWEYPVFPWVIADYKSKTLDLESPSTYRDLSKPIGALNPARLKKFQDHYSSFKDPIIPKFHYGSHYSNPGTVLYYLARIEPFSILYAQLQGAKFDHDDCAFSDVARTWNSVLEGMNDVKELVPEMFYLPEVFTNVNPSGRLGSVALPPWAKNAVDFIHMHRKALESDHVSTRLHEWIDLIFGYKQRGKGAEVANNIFPHVTYDGMVDIDKITDPVQRRSVQNQICYFGQTPSQLLTVPHIRRRSLTQILQLQTIFRNPSEVRSYVLPSPEHCNVPASTMLVSNDCLVVIDSNVPTAHVALHHWQPNTPDGLGAPFLFHHGKNAINSSGGAIFRIFKGSSGSAEDYQFPRAVAFAASAVQSSSAVVVTCDKEVITAVFPYNAKNCIVVKLFLLSLFSFIIGRHADNSVKMISPDGARTIETAFGHLAPVTCLALSADSSYLVTGSRDTTVILWRIRQVGSAHKKNAPEPPPSTPTTPTSPLATGSSSDSSPSKTLETYRRRRIEGPMHVLRGHLGEVTCCSVSSDLGLVGSSSSVSGVLLHSLRTGRLIKKLDVPEAHSICFSSQGIVLVWNEVENRLSTFTVNGIPIATAVVSPFSARVSCIEISTDGQFAAMGTCSSSNDNHDCSTALEDNSELDKPGSDEDVQGSNETRLSVDAPSICFLDLYKLEVNTEHNLLASAMYCLPVQISKQLGIHCQVIHKLKLEEGQDVTALALDQENTTLLVSTADKQLIVYTGPAPSTP